MKTYLAVVVMLALGLVGGRGIERVEPKVPVEILATNPSCYEAGSTEVCLTTTVGLEFADNVSHVLIEIDSVYDGEDSRSARCWAADAEGNPATSEPFLYTPFHPGRAGSTWNFSVGYQAPAADPGAGFYRCEVYNGEVLSVQTKGS